MVKLALRNPAEWILCHGHVCSHLWPPRRYKVGGQEKEWQFPSGIALPWHSDEGCYKEAAPYDHSQSRVRVRGGPVPA